LLLKEKQKGYPLQSGLLTFVSPQKLQKGDAADSDLLNIKAKT
jgi:hypothetical protein